MISTRTQPSPVMRPGERIALLVASILLVVALIGFAIVTARRIADDPAVVMLLPKAEASWIAVDDPTRLRARLPRERKVDFRVRFTPDAVPAEAIMTLQALRGTRVTLNSVPLTKLEPDYYQRWKEQRSIDLAPHLNGVENELVISVYNYNGPCAVLAYCPALDLATDTSWEVRVARGEWANARLAREPAPANLSSLFQHPFTALRENAFLYLAFFLTGTGFVVVPWYLRANGPSFAFKIRAPYVRFAFLGAWVLLALNNMFRIPSRIGFDIRGHIEYIQYIASNLRLPLADEGWQMFQAPLYYIVSAVLYVPFSKITEDPDVTVQALRIVPLTCAVLQVEIGYRTMRAVYPEREDLQIAGTAICGFLPMNVYMAQYVGNEPMAGCMAGLVAMLAILMLRARPDGLAPMRYATAGAALGLAFLTKITALMLTPALAALVFYCGARAKAGEPRRWRAGVSAVGILLSATVLISGWFFVRNWVELGSPVVGVGAEGKWWQDPGFRTPGDFTRFGASLRAPIYAGTHGFLDSLYSTFWLDATLSSMIDLDLRPPWKVGHLVAAVWLGLIPTFAMLAGFVRSLMRPRWALNHGVLFAAACVVLYLGSMAYLYLLIPVYSVGKASYSLGLAPCYALLAVTGLEHAMAKPLGRALCAGALTLWGASVYAAYFVS